MFRKILSIALALVLILGLFSGCSKDAKVESDDSKPATTDSSGETVKLTFHSLIPNQRDEKLVFEEVNKILQEKLNVNVNFVFHGGSFEEKIQVMMGAGEEFDACFTSNWMNSYTLAVSKGAFLDIKDILPTAAPKLQETIPDYFWKAATINGGVYAVPNQQIAARTPIMLMPKEFVDGTGLEFEDKHKLEDYSEYLAKCLEDYGAKTSLVTRSQIAEYLGYEYISDYTGAGVIKMTDSSAKVVNLYETPEWIEFVNLAYDLNQKGLVDSDALTQDDYSENQRKAKKLSLIISGTYKPGVAAEESARAGYECTFGRVETPPYLSTSGLIATMWGVSATSKHPEETLKVLELMNTDPEVYNLLTYGIEGKHYTKTGENTIEVMADSGYMHGHSWAIGNVFNSYLLPGQAPDTWEETKEINDTAARSPILGFSFNPEPVKMQLTSMSKVVDEYISIASGTLPVETTNAEFNKKLRDAGLEDVMAEMQKQVDEFLAS